MLLSLHHQTSTTTTNCRLTKKTPKTCNNSNDDEFYAKLQKIRLSTSAKKPTRGRTAAELLEESKAYFVKSKEVLKKRQCFNEQSLTIPKTTDEYQKDLGFSAQKFITNTTLCLIDDILSYIIFLFKDDLD
ncbi:unnamed protein product [Didymodactylos carnosus]|uniref:Uncharacterized protein n=1 Tax=Didymodactylos carnosus TaxID=1234261 RepID=A0A8S2DWU7_9BILA|nr:unnamed protein product [Didymodactylos carnosus]CAF3838229.1 unnamed protein product [Didymodactylos carnosus]